jgi:hypothetical protein
MAMTPQTYTLEALATETGRDRRTIGKALANVAPDGRDSRGRPVWKLATCMAALDRRGGRVGSAGDVARLSGEAERLIDLLVQGLKRAEAEPNLIERRKVLLPVGKYIGALDRLLEEATGATPGIGEIERPLLDDLRTRVLGDLVRQFCTLGAWECKALGLALPPEIIEDAKAQLAAATVGKSGG